VAQNQQEIAKRVQPSRSAYGSLVGGFINVLLDNSVNY